MHTVNILLFEDFEILDAMGPAEMLARAPGEAFRVNCLSLRGGPVRSFQGVTVDTLPLSQAGEEASLLIPGGPGHRTCIADEAYVETVRALAQRAPYVLTVCTGAVLLAATGLLDGQAATSNKQLFAWAEQTRPNVNWKRSARWVKSGKFYTSSGVTAGMDMTLGFIQDLVSQDAAETTAAFTEYVWNRNSENDPFAAI